MRNRKPILLLVLLLSASLLGGCGGKPGSTPPAADVLDAVIASQPFEELTALPREKLAIYLGFDAAQLADGAMGLDASRATPECVVVLTAANAKALEALKSALADYREHTLAEYRDYRPEEMPKLEHAVLTTSGLQTVLVVCGDPGAAEAALKAIWKQ